MNLPSVQTHAALRRTGGNWDDQGWTIVTVARLAVDTNFKLELNQLLCRRSQVRHCLSLPLSDAYSGLKQNRHVLRYTKWNLGHLSEIQANMKPVGEQNWPQCWPLYEDPKKRSNVGIINRWKADDETRNFDVYEAFTSTSIDNTTLTSMAVEPTMIAAKASVRKCLWSHKFIRLPVALLQVLAHRYKELMRSIER